MLMVVKMLRRRSKNQFAEDLTFVRVFLSSSFLLFPIARGLPRRLPFMLDFGYAVIQEEPDAFRGVTSLG
jgi:hypothetical protein